MILISLLKNLMNFLLRGLKLDRELPSCPSEQKSLDSELGSIFLEPTSHLEIEKIISQMSNKAGGWDGISAKALKCIAPHLSRVLEHIFNLSMDNGCWPDCLKCADIVPVHKEGSKSMLTNYRPIALISNIAKVFEKIVYNRLYHLP